MTDPIESNEPEDTRYEELLTIGGDDRLAQALEALTAAVTGLPAALAAELAVVFPSWPPVIQPVAAPQAPQPVQAGNVVQYPAPQLGPQQGVSWGGSQPVDTGGWVCPVHGTSKVVPAGVSKRTNKPYDAFVACPERGCDQKPPR